MRRSKSVPLVVLGTLVVLEACSPDNRVELKQNRYLSREDCQKDWGDDTACTPATGAGPVASNGGRGGGAFYYGPRYYWDPDAQRPVTLSPNGDLRLASNAHVAGESAFSGESLHAGSIARGGFGGIGRGISMGG